MYRRFSSVMLPTLSATVYMQQVSCRQIASTQPNTFVSSFCCNAILSRHILCDILSGKLHWFPQYTPLVEACLQTTTMRSRLTQSLNRQCVTFICCSVSDYPYKASFPCAQLHFRCCSDWPSLLSSPTLPLGLLRH